MTPKLNRRRALFVLGKIDQILPGNRRSEQERDRHFVALGRYLCETRAGQYWRIDNLKSFDEFLEKKFPESRRKAYYLMAVHERLTRHPQSELEQVGWTKARELVRIARRDGQDFDCAPWVHKAWNAEGGVQTGSRTLHDGPRYGAFGPSLLQGLPQPDAGYRRGSREGFAHAWW